MDPIIIQPLRVYPRPMLLWPRKTRPTKFSNIPGDVALYIFSAVMMLVLPFLFYAKDILPKFLCGLVYGIGIFSELIFSILLVESFCKQRKKLIMMNQFLHTASFYLPVLLIPMPTMLTVTSILVGDTSFDMYAVKKFGMPSVYFYTFILILAFFIGVTKNIVFRAINRIQLERCVHAMKIRFVLRLVQNKAREREMQ